MDKAKKKFDPANTKLLTGISLIEASAGTGKTYAIAMLVLRLIVEHGLDIKNILVVTFTKAATEELKGRIRNRLTDASKIINGNNSNPEENIRLWLDNLTIEPILIQKRLTNALLDIDQAGIYTIHGFCQSVLTEYALESDQLFDSELIGDISAIKQACSDDYWRKQVYQRTAQEASLLTLKYKTPDQLLASVNHIPSNITVIPKHEDLDLKLKELKRLFENSKPQLASSIQIIKEKLSEGKFKKSFENNFDSHCKVLANLFNENSPSTPDFSVFTKQSLYDALNGHKFKKSKTNTVSSEEQKLAYLNTIDINTVLFEQLDTAVNNISLVFRRCLLQTLQIEVENRLQQLNVLSFDDLIIRLADALRNKNGKTLSLLIQQRYQAALIDEFQDTDQNQWFIFSTLFSHNTHYLYLIGDPKQAIYKFRGADIYSYFSAQQQAQHHFTLEQNWRSHPQLVCAINTLFAKDNPFFSKHLGFHPVKAALNSDHGVLKNNNHELPPLILWQLDKGENEYWSSGKASNEIKIAVVNEILDLLNHNFSIQTSTTNTAIQPKDIAILVRSHSQAKEFQFALNEVHITAVVNSKESVFSSKIAIDLYILLQAIAQPSNNRLLKQALTLSGFNLNGQQLLQTLNDEETIDHWISRFQDYQLMWVKKGLMPMMHNLISVENFLSHLSKDKQAERSITNLQHCIELVQQAAIDEHLGINKTLDWLHKNITQSIARKTTTEEQQLRLESDEDAVKIITMHSSKGLEYPIVFCPFLWQRSTRLQQEKEMITCHPHSEMVVDLGSNKFEYHRSLALDEELAEDLRIAYVALTRAKLRCYINWADVRTKDKANESALSYLMQFSTDNFNQQQERLQNYGHNQPLAFEYRLINTGQEFTSNWQAIISKDKLLCQQRYRTLYTHWQMSSYTALSSLSIDDTPELPHDKVREDIIVSTSDQDIVELPRGSHTGNVIHDLLENIPFSTLAGQNNISLQRNKSCLRYGLQTSSPDLIDQLLRNTVNTILSNEDENFCLKDLNEHQCLKEMPFYLSMKTMNISQINLILKDYPTYKPLSDKKLCGYLTGFIDLICEYHGKYYLMDYKSNSLENYEQDRLIVAMREHNYGLQYWIYTLVLHLYLQQRISDYSYEKHFGGVKYLFVRGMNAHLKNSGIYQTKPALNKIEQLAKLFIS